RIVELEDEDILPSENTSEHPIGEESLASIVSQEKDVILVRRSARTHKAPDRLCLNVEIDPDRLCFNVEVVSLGDLYEPANYKAALSDPEFEKWLVAMNAEMQSMYDNKVWRLVVLPPNAKVVKSKWIYKKKTNMDGKEATFIIGIKIYKDRSRRLIGLSQNAYLDKILKRYRMDNSKCGSIPVQVDLHLSKSQCATTSAEMKRMQNILYASAVGSIMYANSGKAHWTVVKNILKYLRNTKDTFLVYGYDPEAELQVNCYCDAGFETDIDDTKSQTGYVFVLNGGAMVWKSSKQSTTAQPATEAEYIAAPEAAKEVIWIRKFIDELCVVPSNDYPIKMKCDNFAAIIMAKESRI
nr:hypothetical protein [Tanacetum cinerariifolium]